MTIFEASQQYAARKIPLILFAGKDYGMGSSRDWAAKGTALLGVRAVVARSFERIHRSNLIGMGILPLEFTSDQSYESLRITGEELFTLHGLEEGINPNQQVILIIDRDGKKTEALLKSRIDTPMEAEYYRHGGILPFMLRHLLTEKQKPSKRL